MTDTQQAADVAREYEAAVRLANRVLDKPFIDPDGDICLLARQFLRQVEWTAAAHAAGRAEMREALDLAENVIAAIHDREWPAGDRRRGAREAAMMWELSDAYYQDRALPDVPAQKDDNDDTTNT